MKGIGWLLYYNRQWSERWTSSIGFSEHRQFTTQGQNDDAYEVGQYGNVNVLFHPTPGMYVGPEFIWGRLENRDGADGTDTPRPALLPLRLRRHDHRSRRLG